MANTFALPAVGDTMVEGEIVEWFVSVGDEINLDQTICSLETDKSVVEMTTPFRGTVLQLGGQVGDIIEVGSPLIVVGEAGEAVPERGTSPPGPITTEAASPEDLMRPTAPALSGGATVAAVDSGAGAPTLDVAVVGNSNGAVLAMPKVRRLARERSVDLRTVSGTGPRGSVLESDLAPVPAAGEGRERLSAMRRTIAEHLTESVREVPQFTSMVDVDLFAWQEIRISRPR